MTGSRSMVTGRRMKGTTRRTHIDVWPKFEPETANARVEALRERDRLIVATRLNIRFGPDSGIAQMLGLGEVA